MANAMGAGCLRSWYFVRCAQLCRAAIQKPIRRGPFTSARMIASLRTPVSGSFVIVMPEPRYRPASPSEWMGMGSRVMSAASPMSFTSLQGPSLTSFDCPGTLVNIRSDSSRTTECGDVPRASAWRARSFTRMSQSCQPGNPRRLSRRIGRGAAEHSAPACVMGSTSSLMRMRSGPTEARKSRRLSAIVVLPSRSRCQLTGDARARDHLAGAHDPRRRPLARERLLHGRRLPYEQIARVARREPVAVETHGTGRVHGHHVEDGIDLARVCQVRGMGHEERHLELTRASER